MENKFLVPILVVLIYLGWIILRKAQDIKKELKEEKAKAKELAAMTPEDIQEKYSVDIRAKLNFFSIALFILSISTFILLPLFALTFITEKGLADTILEKVIIFVSIAIPVMLFTKFGIEVIASRSVKELREMGEKIKTENYHLFTFKRAVIVVIITCILTFLFWYITTLL